MNPPGGRNRDRDQAGRPRNARPRDAFGRPLPRSAEGEPRVPDDLALAPEAAVETADRMLSSDRPFHAHEVLEACWKSAAPAERDLWQGLAQVAVGLTHARRGNARGAAALLRRGAERVRSYAASDAGGSGVPHAGVPHAGDMTAGNGPQPYGADLTRFVAGAESLAGRIEREGLGGIRPEDLRLRLRDAQP